MQKPHAALQKFMRGRSGLLQKELVAVLEAGSKLLAEQCGQPRGQTPRETDSIREEEEYYVLPGDMKKKLRDLRQLPLAIFLDSAKNQRAERLRTQFIAYCRMFQTGIALRQDLGSEKITNIQQQLLRYIEAMRNIEAMKHMEAMQHWPQQNEATAPVAQLYKKEQDGHMKIEIARLHEILSDYLDELSVDPGPEAWEEIDENAGYGKYVAYRNKTVVRLYAEYFPVVFLLFEAPLEQCYYLIWIESADNYVNLEKYAQSQDALQHILTFLHANSEYSLDPAIKEFTVTYMLDQQESHHVTYCNDNRQTFARKVEALL